MLGTQDALSGRVDAAMRSRLPVVSSLREFTDAGGLFTYGTSITDTSRRAAGYVENSEGSEAGEFTNPATDKVRADR